MDNFKNDINRRKFIEAGLKTAGAAALATVPSLKSFAGKREYTVNDVIEIIYKDVPGAGFNRQTVDTIKSGAGLAKVNGIVTTMFPTIEVIRKTIAMNVNFIIAHGDTFYNYADDINWAGPSNVVKQKQEMLVQNGITIWRFHDNWHDHHPDGIVYGVLKKLNWLKYNSTGEKTFSIPPSSLKQIIDYLKTSLGIDHVRVIGDLSASCEKITFLPGAWAGQNQIKKIELDNPDLAIVGELHEWETAEFIRDARLLGSKTSLVVLGHSVSEEPGMEYLVDWLQPKLEGIKVSHIASNSPFTWA